MYTKLPIFIVVIAIGILGLFFRGSVVRMLHFGQDVPPPSVVVPAPGAETGTTTKVISPTTTDKNPAPPEVAVPPYHGRALDEIRPILAEVNVFSGAEREEIYGQISTYAKGVTENPDYFFWLIQVGLLKKVIGDYIGARDAWEYAGMIRPANSVSFANLGELYWHYLSDFPKAEMNFKKSIQNKPDDPATYQSLADLYWYSLKEKADQASEILKQGIAANPGDVNLIKALAALYQRQNDYPNALLWWQKVLESEPNNTGVAQEIDMLKKKINN